MYNSGILTMDLIANVADEADIVIPIASSSWYRWINAVEQFVYSEIFKLYRAAELWFSDIDDAVSGPSIDLKTDIEASEDCAVPDFDDIVKIFADDTELDRCGVISGVVFLDKPLYYTDYSGVVKLNIPFGYEKITVIYKLKPKLKGADDGSYINLPIEFVDMLTARLRAEAYKLANDDGQSAKWMSDYNTQLETLKAWAAMRNERYGE